MPTIYQIFINITIWVLFFKGVLLIPATIYAIRAYLVGQASPMVSIAACAAGTFAFTMACVVILIRKKLE